MFAKEEVKKEVFQAAQDLSIQTGLSVWNYIEEAYRHYKRVVKQNEYGKTNRNPQRN